MIKVNVKIGSKPWYKKIKNSKSYFSLKLKKISKKIYYLKKKNITFTIFLTNSITMKKLNKKFRNKNRYTDVLSFPNFSIKNLKLPKEKNIYIGDIAVCYQIINKRSKNSNFKLEFDKAWVHGFLHLLGFDHMKNKDYFKMNKIENKILSSFEPN